MHRKLVGLMVLFLMVFLICWPAHDSAMGEPQKEWTVEAIREELGKEYKWIMWGVDRTIYVSRLDGSDRRVVFDGVGEEGDRISYLKSSYDGSVVAVTLYSTSSITYSIWVINLGANDQWPIVLDSKDRPFNLEVSTDGSYIVWTISSETRRAFFYDIKQERSYVLGGRYSRSASPEISYDSTRIIFLGFYQNTWVLCEHTLATGKEQQISKPEEGRFWNPSYYGQTYNILTPLAPVGKDYRSLWLFNPTSREFTFLAEIKNEDPKLPKENKYLSIFGAYSSRKNNVVIFTTGHNFYSLIESEITKLSETVIDYGEYFAVHLDLEGKYAVYYSENSPRYLSRTDALYRIELKELLDISDHIAAIWYNHPPFPPKVRAKALENVNQLDWEASARGSYPILGYRVYRRLSSSRKYELVQTTSPEVLEYTDTEFDLTKNYHYLVRAFDEDDTESLSSNEIFFDRVPPEITLIYPESRTWFAMEKVVLRGRAFDKDSGIDFATINDENLELDPEGFFNHAYTLKMQGKNEISLLAVDSANNRTMKQFELFLDSIPPEIEVNFPQEGVELFTLDTNSRGRITDQGSGVATLQINYQNVDLEEDGSYSFPIAVKEGNNALIFTAKDKVGNTTERRITFKGVARILVKLTIGSQVISVNNTIATIDAPPFIEETSGRTMVPARFVVEPIGGVITFDAKEQKVTIKRRENTIELWIGKNTAQVNGITVPIDSNPLLTPVIVSGRTFLPLRFVAENIGFKISWDPINHVITLEFPDPDKLMTNAMRVKGAQYE